MESVLPGLFIGVTDFLILIRRLDQVRDVGGAGEVRVVIILGFIAW